MSYYDLTITGKKYADARQNVTRQFWVDRTGSNENDKFIKLVRMCSNMSEVQALTGALPSKRDNGPALRRALASYEGHSVCVTSLKIELASESTLFGGNESCHEKLKNASRIIAEMEKALDKERSLRLEAKRLAGNILNKLTTG